jgi:hypothetical protein
VCLLQAIVGIGLNLKIELGPNCKIAAVHNSHESVRKLL